MLSMPPATMMSAVPAARASWAMIAACMPEPHILLTVVAWVHRSRQARAQRRLARRRLAQAGGQDAAHEDLLDPVGRSAGALQRRLHRGRPQLGGAEAPLSAPWKPPIGVRA